METDPHVELKQLVKENSELLKENNKILKKLYRNDILGIWARILWIVLLIGLPFALYFYVFEPYFTALGSSYETFLLGMHEIPGLKHFSQAIDQFMQALEQARTK